MDSDSGSGGWEARFPRLFAASYVGYADAWTRYRTGPPPDALVSRLHVVAVNAADLVVVCRSVQEWWFLPGGTREPGESLPDLARRELLEESGAELRGDLVVFSSHEADSLRSRPFRPHLPHPRTHWAYAAARVELTGPPTNPPDGEQVVEVLTLPVTEAARRLDEQDDPVHADVVRHAAASGVLDRLA